MAVKDKIKEIVNLLEEEGLDFSISEENLITKLSEKVSTLLNEYADQQKAILLSLFKTLKFDKNQDWNQYIFCKSIENIDFKMDKIDLPENELNRFNYHYSIATQEFGNAIKIDFKGFKNYLNHYDYGFSEKELSTIIPFLLNSKEKQASKIVDNLFTHNINKINKIKRPAEFICNLNINDNLKFEYLKELDLTGNDYAEIIQNVDITKLSIAENYKISLSITKDLVNNVNNALDNYSLDDIADHCFLITNALHLKADKEENNLFRSEEHYGKTLNYLDQNFYCLEAFELEKITDYVNNLSNIDLEPFHDYLREHTDTLLAFSKPEHFKRGIPNSILFSLKKNEDIFFDKFLSEPVAEKNELLYANFAIIKHVEDNVHLFESKIEENPLIFYLHLRSMYQDDLENNILFEEVVKNNYMLFSQLEDYPLIELSDDEYDLIDKVIEKLELREQLNFF